MAELGNRKPISYKKSFCAFLDILGFESLVNKNDDQSKDKLEKYFGIIDFIEGYLEGIDSKRDIGILAISDSIILTLEMKSDEQDNIDKFRHFLIAVNIIQSTLARNDIWLRGGISFGNVCFEPSESFIVGKGYIKSYRLEQLAIYPRVVIDPVLPEELGFKDSQSFIEKINKTSEGGINFSNWKTDIVFNWKKVIPSNNSLKRDTPFFLDYMSSFFTEEGQLDIIINYLKKNSMGDIRHYEKYKWVADYMVAITDQDPQDHLNHVQGPMQKLKEI